MSNKESFSGVWTTFLILPLAFLWVVLPSRICWITANIENIERETIQITRSLESELETVQTKLRSMEMNEWIGTKDDTEAIRTEIREHERLSKAWILATHVRAATCQLSCGLPGHQHVAKRRLSEIQEAINRPISWKTSAPEFLNPDRQPSPQSVQFSEHSDERRQQLKSEVDSLTSWVVHNEAQLSETLRRDQRLD